MSLSLSLLASVSFLISDNLSVQFQKVALVFVCMWESRSWLYKVNRSVSAEVFTAVFLLLGRNSFMNILFSIVICLVLTVFPKSVLVTLAVKTNTQICVLPQVRHLG